MEENVFNALHLLSLGFILLSPSQKVVPILTGICSFYVKYVIKKRQVKLSRRQCYGLVGYYNPQIQFG